MPGLAELAAAAARAGQDDADQNGGEAATPAARDPAELAGGRQAIAAAVADLDGDDGEVDGLCADMIDGGDEAILWALDPTPDRYAIAPNLDDALDPAEWLEKFTAFDMPNDLLAPVERLARAMTARLEQGEHSIVRADFAARLAALFRAGGVEVLAVRGAGGGFDWIVMNADDVARETDGEPWRPPGGFESGGELLLLGHSLGLGGQVWLWPASRTMPASAKPEPLAAPSGNPASVSDQAAAMPS